MIRFAKVCQPRAIWIGVLLCPLPSDTIAQPVGLGEQLEDVGCAAFLTRYEGLRSDFFERRPDPRLDEPVDRVLERLFTLFDPRIGAPDSVRREVLAEMRRLEALAGDREEIAKILAFQIPSVASGSPLEALLWAYRQGGYPQGPLAVVIGDLEESLQRRLDAVTLVEAIADSNVAVAMMRSACQLTLWADAVPVGADSDATIPSLYGRITGDGASLFLGVMEELNSAWPTIRRWMPCEALEQCLGRSSFALRLWRQFRPE